MPAKMKPAEKRRMREERDEKAQELRVLEARADRLNGHLKQRVQEQARSVRESLQILRMYVGDR